MAKMWKNSCKNLSKSTLKKCEEKSAKVINSGFTQKFYKVFNVVLNRNFSLLNRMFYTVST